MSEFKVGDEVVLLPRKEEWRFEGPAYVDEMVEYCESGRSFTITGFLGGWIDTTQWTVMPEWITHIPTSLDNV